MGSPIADCTADAVVIALSRGKYALLSITCRAGVRVRPDDVSVRFGREGESLGQPLPWREFVPGGFVLTVPTASGMRRISSYDRAAIERAGYALLLPHGCLPTAWRSASLGAAGS